MDNQSDFEMVTSDETAAATTGAQAGVRMARTVAERILAQGRLGVRARGFWHGAPGPELMQGMAGIGYQLLRTASPSAVPSVLAFEPPAISPGDHR